MRFLIFVLGAAVGSFLNVLVWRSGREKKWVWERSVCDDCGRRLRWWENIPVISFLFLCGRCRTCRFPIPREYPVVELATGIIFFLINFQFPISNFQFPGLILHFIFYAIATLLIAVFLFDFHYQIIPDWATIVLILLTIPYHFLFCPQFLNSYILKFLYSYLPPALVAAGFFLFLHLITQGRGMGLGDVKFAFFMGFFFGFPKIIFAFYLAFLTGAATGVILILIKRKKFGQRISFGPFLVLATFVIWFWGEELVKCVKAIMG